MTTFRSLDLTDAITTGWRSDLNAKEFRVLNWIATRGSGKRSQRPGYPFTWQVLYGTDDWATLMSLPRSTLFRVLDSLQKKGLVVKLPGSKPIYGIPTQALLEAVTWNVERKDMVAFLRAARVSELRLKHPDSVSELRLQSPTSETPESDQKPGLTCEDAPDFRKQENREGSTREKEDSLKRVDASGVDACNAPESTQETTVSDGWDVPTEERDDFDVPQEVKDRADKPIPVTRTLADSFEKQWTRARVQRPMLAVAFNNRGLPYTQLKLMLRDYTQEQIESMFIAFFRKVSTNTIQLRADQLWLDFYNNRGAIWKIVAASPTQVAADDWSEIDALANRNKTEGS